MGRRRRGLVFGVWVFVLFVAVFGVVLSVPVVEGSGTIYIRADGSIDPPTAPISSYDNVTYTFLADIYDKIVVERSNITIDGAGHTLQGTEAHESKGIDLSGISNVTIKNTNIRGFYDGIYLHHSSDNSIVGNSITANNQNGVRIYYSSNNSIVGNNVTANNWHGIYLITSPNNAISGNNVTVNNWHGIVLYESSDNSISGNNITANNADGIELWWVSSYNSISGNKIVNNSCGIYLGYSSNNFLYHNNLINNTNQVSTYDSVNVWDDGYPSGGNSWSDHTTVDEKSGPNQDQLEDDGIGDTPYVIDENNRDRYPLMAPFSTFDAGTWNEIAYDIDMVSNSTSSNFHLNETQRTISFNVSGMEGTASFCRVTVPNVIVEEFWQGNYTVLLNGEPWPFTNWTDAANTYIYINYSHSEHQVIIVPEFPTPIILPLFMIFTLVAVTLTKKDNRRHQQF